jgi:hypothetical protein
MVAFVTLASAALFLGSNGSVAGAGSSTNSDVTAAVTRSW